MKVIVLNNEQDEQILSDIFDAALKFGGSEIYGKIKHVDLALTKIVKSDKPTASEGPAPEQKKEEKKSKSKK